MNIKGLLRNTIVSKDSLDDFFPMSGGISLSLHEPSREQKEAEAKVRSILFMSNPSVSGVFQNLSETYSKKDGEVLASKRRMVTGRLGAQTLFPPTLSDQENTHDHRSESMKLLDKLSSPSDDELKKKYEQQMVEIALNSPMFNDRDGNGITTAYIGSGIHMDTATLHLNLEPASFQNSILNTSDQKWSTDLDDFFPQPLQPFSF